MIHSLQNDVNRIGDFCDCSGLAHLSAAHRSVLAVLRHQLPMSALLCNPAALDQNDDIRVADGGQAVGDDERGASLGDGQHGTADFLLGHGIYGAGRLV